jgi:uncharacterized protein YbbC (DUF1343 family)
MAMPRLSAKTDKFVTGAEKRFCPVPERDNLVAMNRDSFKGSRKKNRFKYKSMGWLLVGLIFFGKLDAQPIPAAHFPEKYLPTLHGKRVGLIANHTSFVDSVHLVDFFLQNQVNLQRIFAPEHGFRGEESAGALIKDNRDVKTGLLVASLYGKKKKPTREDLEGLDILVFDIQDVGVRFYTYISTMTYCMEAAAEFGIPFLVLDRPNPNGHYVDGPVLRPGFESFVGLHPVPVVHGMTVGEYAQMVNGEGWLSNGIKCSLTVILCEKYTHQSEYILPIKPSPNLPNQQAIYNYPSLCFFEGTVVSVGRGTDFPFQVYGAPWMRQGNFRFTPKSKPGAMSPPFENQLCIGVDLRQTDDLRRYDEIQWQWLLDAYQQHAQTSNFFNSFFNKLAGNETLKKQIVEGGHGSNLKNSWKAELAEYKQMRIQYLLYAEN